MAREHLTEDQKRKNHIKSEQKQRMLIKKGFMDLNELVPELRGEEWPRKSAVLTMAADWLEEPLRRNEGLRVLFVELEGRGGCDVTGNVDNRLVKIGLGGRVLFSEWWRELGGVGAFIC